METTLLEVGKKAIFPQKFQNALDRIDIGLAWVFDIDENIIQIDNNKDIQLFDQNLINIALEAGGWLDRPKNIILYSKWPY